MNAYGMQHTNGISVWDFNVIISSSSELLYEENKSTNTTSIPTTNCTLSVI